MFLQCLDGVSGGFLWRIKECQIPDQYHVTLVFYTKCANRRRIALLGNGKHTEALIIESIYSCQDFLLQFPGQGLNTIVIFCKRADCQHFLNGSLGDHLGLAGFIPHYCGQTATGKVKGNLINLNVVF